MMQLASLERRTNRRIIQGSLYDGFYILLTRRLHPVRYPPAHVRRDCGNRDVRTLIKVPSRYYLAGRLDDCWLVVIPSLLAAIKHGTKLPVLVHVILQEGLQPHSNCRTGSACQMRFCHGRLGRLSLT